MIDHRNQPLRYVSPKFKITVDEEEFEGTNLVVEFKNPVDQAAEPVDGEAEADRLGAEVKRLRPR